MPLATPSSQSRPTRRNPGEGTMPIHPPRVRFTVRRLMIAVAVAGFSAWG